MPKKKDNPVPLFQVDAFTSKPFCGNPAAVCLFEEFPEDEILKNIAAEMNLSETAFVVHRPSKKHFEIRWFTPAVEVPLCGHATLAASHVLFNETHETGDTIHYDSKSGALSARREGERIVLDFPLNSPETARCPKGVLQALGIETFRATALSSQAKMLLIEIGDEKTLRNLSPDMSALLASDRGGMPFEGVIVTAPSKDFDFVSRYFGPWEGIDEDPVTGSAHTVLAPFWSEKLEKLKFHAFQASRRGGELFLRICEGNRLDITGEARTVFEGKLYPWP
ncbi:MAG: PhzF family phenazine biosynthesis protein [Thermovirgaceae bacterium]